MQWMEGCNSVTGIYEIINTTTGRRYIGSSINLRCRWYSHSHMLRKGKHGNPILQSSWNKHGESAFVFRHIEENVDNENYMFWQNIKNIHHSCNEILNMDKVHVNNILNNGHDWAIDHVSTSFDDIEEVYHFLDSNIENNIN